MLFSRESWKISETIINPKISNMKSKLITCLAMLVMSISLAAQTRSVTGVVTSSVDGLPLPGVVVTVQDDNTRYGLTDLDGKYTVANVESGDVLVYTMMGFTTQSITITDQTDVDVILAEEATMLEEIINMANACVQPDKWLESWRYAAGLYVAHYATLYLRTYAPSNTTAQQAAASGALVGVVKSATLGDSSVSYDTTAVTKGTEDWGDLNSTTYGQMLANRAKLVGLGGSYAI